MLPVVEEIDKEMLKKLREKRSYFLRIPKTSTALRRAMRESYFLHVYHTVAIEGNTMSLGQTRFFFLLSFCQFVAFRDNCADVCFCGRQL